MTKRIGEAAHRALCGGAVELQFKEWTDGGEWTLILADPLLRAQIRAVAEQCNLIVEPY